MAEIEASLAVGREVITHTHPVSVPGWSGAGYTILDPDTGVGAWKIGGGKNGSYTLVEILGMDLLLFVLSSLLIPGLNFFVFSLFIGFVAASIVLFTFAVALYNNGDMLVADILCSTAVALLVAALLVILKKPVSRQTIQVVDFLIATIAESLGTNSIAAGCRPLGEAI